MAGEAAVDGDTEKTLFDAQVLVAVETVAALAAADPGEYRFFRADQLLRNIRTDFLDDPGDLMSERKRQRHATRGVQLLAAAEVSVTVLNMKVGMAQPATFDPDEDFLALRFRRLDDGFTQRRIEFDQ
jgi:hypothetical protein